MTTTDGSFRRAGGSTQRTAFQIGELPRTGTIDAPMAQSRPLSVNPLAQREFLERYEQLVVWAVRLTGRREIEAHDLVHDAFVAYAEGRRGDEIRNINGYLYGILRNLLRAQRNRAEARLRAPLEVAELAPGSLSDPGVDVATQLEARQTLLEIARFARERSQRSKAGTALLLRYFHGFTPREIARIMRIPVSNVDDWLKLARREARAIANSTPTIRRPAGADSSTIRFFPKIPGQTTGADAAEALLELRHEVLHEPPGRCLSAWKLKRLYRSEPTAPIETKALAHIVACPICLDRVSDRLGFPGISERHPVDELTASSRAESKHGRRVAVGVALVIAAILGWGPGRAYVEAAASAVMRVARAVIGSIAGPRNREHEMRGLPSRPFSSLTPLRPILDAPPRALVRSAGRTVSEATALGLELEALHLLDRQGELLGRQFDLSQDHVGRVRFATLAINAEERAKIQTALAPLASTSDFVAVIRTAEDPIQLHSRTPSSAIIVVRELELSQEPTPLLRAVRQHMAEGEVPRFVNRLLSGSREARLHASLMVDLLRRFDVDKLRSLNPGAHATLDTMLRYHALAVARAAARVRSDLASAAAMSHSAEVLPGEPSGEDVAVRAARLREQTAFIDEALGVELAAAPVDDSRASVAVSDLLGLFLQTERLAELIAGI